MPTTMAKLFYNLSDTVYDSTNDMHVKVLRFAFNSLLQRTLNEFTSYWNNHQIRRSSDAPGGIPDVLFYSDTTTYALVMGDCVIPIVCVDVDDYFSYVINQLIMSVPQTKDEALYLFNQLLRVCWVVIGNFNYHHGYLS